MRIYDHEHSNTLNPAAEEWRPVPQPSPILPLVIFQAPPLPPPPLYYYHHFYTYSHLPQPPVYPLSQPAAPIESPPVKVEDAPRHHGKRGSKRDHHLPPRLRSRRASKAQQQQSPPPPPPRKQERRRNKLPPSDRPPQKQNWNRNVSGVRIPPKVSGEGTVAADAASQFQTTVMIKNIPNDLRRDFMLKFVERYCRRYSLEFDFLYLPIDFSTLGNLGYAFVNFTTPAYANKFKNVVSNYKWRAIYNEDGEPPIICSKIVETTWARTQGIHALRKRFQNSKFECNDSDFLPVELDPPRNGWDPNPTPPVILGRICG